MKQYRHICWSYGYNSQGKKHNKEKYNKCTKASRKQLGVDGMGLCVEICKLCRVYYPKLNVNEAIGKHLETQHGTNRTKTDHLIKVLKKYNRKFD